MINVSFADMENNRGGIEEEMELIKRIREQDTDALAELYDLYNRLLFGMIISIVKKREKAEEVLMGVFLNVWHKADLFDIDRGNVFNWMVTLARTRAVSYSRSKGDESFAVLVGDQQNPMRTTVFSDRTELVKKALNQVSEEQREVVKIAFYRGMTQSEISDSLGITPETVKTRMQQGMMKLKTILGNYISTDG